MAPYNSVKPRLSLGDKTKVDYHDSANWPIQMVDFITRSFNKSSQLNLSADKTAKFENELKELVNMAISQEKVLENNWDIQTLPSIDTSSNGGKLELVCNTLQNTSNILNNKNKLSHTTGSPRPLKKTKKSNKNSAAKNTDESDSVLSSEYKKQLRGQRFERELSANVSDFSEETEIRDLNTPLVGTNTNLEKHYLRLTSEPKPETVRPLNILKKSFKMLNEKYIKDSANYGYLCDQLRSLRQDLTVQHIRNEFTIRVYEFNCKVSIDFDDMGEFNRCQSQLKFLYRIFDKNNPNMYDFLAYTVLYYILTNNHFEAFQLKLYLIEKDDHSNKSEHSWTGNSLLIFAFQVLENVINGEYYDFFERVKLFRSLQESKPFSKLSPYYTFDKLLCSILVNERIKALCMVCKSFKLLPLSFVIDQLAFKDKIDYSDFLKNNGLEQLDQFTTEDKLDCSKAKFIVEGVRGKKFKKIDIKGQI